MVIQTTSRWYQKHEMLTEAQHYGYTASEELIDDWIDKGLLGEAGKRERPGRGSRAWWSQEQHDLFLRLLAHRQREENKIRIGPLCNIPVCAWLYCGELSGVNLDQVKRAMKTWMDYQRKVPEEQIRKSVTQMVRRYQTQGAIDKRTLIDELTAIGTLSKDGDPEELRFLFESVVYAHTKKKKGKGLAQEQFKLVDYLSEVFPLRLQALKVDNALFDVAGCIWQWARTANLVALARYAHVQPALAADPRLGDQFERATFKNLCEQSCSYLLTLLGIVHRNTPPSEHANDKLATHLQSWMTGEATSVIQTRIVYSQLVFPDGRPIPYVRNEVTISYREIRQQYALDLSYI